MLLIESIFLQSALDSEGWNSSTELIGKVTKTYSALWQAQHSVHSLVAEDSLDSQIYTLRSGMRLSSLETASLGETLNIRPLDSQEKTAEKSDRDRLTEVIPN